MRDRQQMFRGVQQTGANPQEFRERNRALDLLEITKEGKEFIAKNKDLTQMETGKAMSDLVFTKPAPKQE